MKLGESGPGNTLRAFDVACTTNTEGAPSFAFFAQSLP